MSAKIVWPGIIILAHSPKEDCSDLMGKPGIRSHHLPFHFQMSSGSYIDEISALKKVHPNGGVIVAINGGHHGFENLLIQVKHSNLWSKKPWPFLLTHGVSWSFPISKDEGGICLGDEFLVSTRQFVFTRCIELLLPDNPHLRQHLVSVGETQEERPDPDPA